MNELPPQNFTLAKGQDWPLEIRVIAPEKRLKLSGDAEASAVSLFVDGDHPALLDGEKFLFGDHVVVTIDGAVAAGVRNVTVEALAGPLQRGELGQMLRDLTGATLQFEASLDGADATPAVSKTGGDIVILTQTGEDRGKFQVAGVAADWDDADVGEYVWHAWRRNSGSSRPVARGVITLEKQGFV